MRFRMVSFVALALVCLASASWAADGQPWQVAKATGEVWLTKSDRKTVSLTSSSELQAGDTIQTGPSGRIMLTRGEERIVMSPNTSIGIPTQAARYPSTITQQSGTILLEVERKNVQHFEVETPYLAAVVKGTMFRVTVDRRGSKVDVLRGQVQVADLKTGQFALIAPGQAARVRANALGGLTLSGRGKFSPVERGAPRTPTVQASKTRPGVAAQAKAAAGEARGATKASIQRMSGHTVRINAAIGEMKLDLHKVTKGLAHAPSATHTQVGSDSKGAVAGGESGFTSGSLNASPAAVGNASRSGNSPNGAVSSNGSTGGNANAGSSGTSGNSASNAVAQGSNKQNEKAGNSGDETGDAGKGKADKGNGKGNNGNGNGNGGSSGNVNNGNGNGNGNGKVKTKG